VGGLAALVFLAYSASAHVAVAGAGDFAALRHAAHAGRAGRVGLHGQAGLAGHATRTGLRVRATLIPSDEVIVGHPRDGIVELPGAMRTVPR
jgi:hypothetical protein